MIRLPPILPCPFCGHPGTLLPITTPVVGCQHCGARGCWWKEKKRDAIEMWNMRVSSTTLPLLPENDLFSEESAENIEKMAPDG